MTRDFYANNLTPSKHFLIVDKTAWCLCPLKINLGQVRATDLNEHLVNAWPARGSNGRDHNEFVKIEIGIVLTLFTDLAKSEILILLRKITYIGTLKDLNNSGLFTLKCLDFKGAKPQWEHVMSCVFEKVQFSMSTLFLNVQAWSIAQLFQLSYFLHNFSWQLWFLHIFCPKVRCLACQNT